MPAPSLPPQQHGSSPSSPNPPLPSHLTWTIAHEERLVYVQRHLTAAQAAWSEDQDLWIDEVTQLESLKRKCAKAGKKVAGGGGGGGGAGGRKGSLGGILKKGSWKGKSKTSPNDSPLDSPTAVEGSPGRGEMGEEDEEDEDDDGRRGEVTWAETPTFTRRSSISTLLKRTMSLNSNRPGVGSSRRNTFDGGQPVRPTLTESPDGSYSSSEMKGKLLKRRGSGR